MRKIKPNKNQIDLDFGATPPQETRPTESIVTDSRKDPAGSTELGSIYRRAAVEDNDKDEDPQAQRAREWKNWGRQRRA